MLKRIALARHGVDIMVYLKQETLAQHTDPKWLISEADRLERLSQRMSEGGRSTTLDLVRRLRARAEGIDAASTPSSFGSVE